MWTYEMALIFPLVYVFYVSELHTCPFCVFFPQDSQAQRPINKCASQFRLLCVSGSSYKWQMTPYRIRAVNVYRGIPLGKFQLDQNSDLISYLDISCFTHTCYKHAFVYMDAHPYLILRYFGVIYCYQFISGDLPRSRKYIENGSRYLVSFCIMTIWMGLVELLAKRRSYCCKAWHLIGMHFSRKCKFMS